jgi:hypothetical protein
MIPKVIHGHWEKERIENIHDKLAVAERYGWNMVDPLIEMEIDRRKREIEEGKRRDFFNSEREKKANRFLKRLFSRNSPESRFVRLLKKTP